MPKEKNTAVLLHGAGTGAWVWDRVQAVLKTPSLAVDLPLSHEKATPESCAEFVAEKLTALETPGVVLVLHSWAGALSGTLAMMLGSRLTHTVYLSAVIPPDGAAFVDALPIPQRWIVRRLFSRNPEGLRPTDSMIRREYCNDLCESDTGIVTQRFAAQRPEPYLAPALRPGAAGACTYVALKRDRSVSPGMQRRYIRRLNAPEVVSVDAGHLAMLSRPAEIAAVIDRIARET